MGEACNICGAKALKGGGMPVDGKMYCYRCIVRAVNAHDALVVACEAAFEADGGDECRHDHHGLCQTHNLRRNAAGEPECQVPLLRAALALAKK